MASLSSPHQYTDSMVQPLSDDSVTEKMWHYQDPTGIIQGPYLMVQLRKWSTNGYFPSDMRIWREHEEQDDSILLTDALNGQFERRQDDSPPTHVKSPLQLPEQPLDFQTPPVKKKRTSYDRTTRQYSLTVGSEIISLSNGPSSRFEKVPDKGDLVMVKRKAEQLVELEGKKKKKKKEGSKPRPACSWVIFSREFIKEYSASHPESSGLKAATMAASEAWKSMSLEEKGKYTGRAREGWEDYLSTAPARAPRPRKQTKLVTRCSPGRLFNVLQRLTPDQKAAVKSIGFGSLLSLRCRTLRRSLCLWLLERFNTSRRSLEICGEHIPLSSRDVELVMGLAASGKDVVTSGPDDIIAELRRTYSATNRGISVRFLEERLAAPEAGEDFKRSFVLYALGTLLCPTARLDVSPSFLYLLTDMDVVYQYNWGKFLLDRLVREVSRFRQGKQRAVGGCLLFLQLFYYECISVERPDTLAPAVYPSLSSWGEEEITEREKKERELGGYGFGEVNCKDRCLPMELSLYRVDGLPASEMGSNTEHDLVLEQRGNRFQQKTPSKFFEVVWRHCIFSCSTTKREKFDGKKRECTFIGYGDESNGFHIYHPTITKLIISRDAVFDKTRKRNWNENSSPNPRAMTFTKHKQQKKMEVHLQDQVLHEVQHGHQSHVHEIPPDFPFSIGGTLDSDSLPLKENKPNLRRIKKKVARVDTEVDADSEKFPCRNGTYGCEETVDYAERNDHEEMCIFTPCKCPLPDCNFVGASEQLSLHFSSRHWDSGRRFKYNSPLAVSLSMDEPFLVLQAEEDGLLFLLNKGIETVGITVMISCIGPVSSKEKFCYDIVSESELSSVRLKSVTRNFPGKMEGFASMDFLLVPFRFLALSGKLNLEVCIWGSTELDEDFVSV